MKIDSKGKTHSLKEWHGSRQQQQQQIHVSDVKASWGEA